MCVGTKWECPEIAELADRPFQGDMRCAEANRSVRRYPYGYQCGQQLNIPPAYGRSQSMQIKKLLSKSLSIALVCALASVGAPLGLAQPPAGAGATAGTQPLMLPPGDISGTVYLPDMKTPVRGVDVFLRDKETGEKIASAVTDARGNYTLKNVPEGNYYVYAGNPIVALVVAEIKVAKEAQPRKLDFAITRVLASTLTEARPGPPGKPAFLNAKLLIGVGTAVVVAGIVVLLEEKPKRRYVSPLFP